MFNVDRAEGWTSHSLARAFRGTEDPGFRTGRLLTRLHFCRARRVLPRTVSISPHFKVGETAREKRHWERLATVPAFTVPCRNDLWRLQHHVWRRCRGELCVPLSSLSVKGACNPRSLPSGTFEKPPGHPNTVLGRIRRRRKRNLGQPLFSTT